MASNLVAMASNIMKPYETNVCRCVFLRCPKCQPTLCLIPASVSCKLSLTLRLARVSQNQQKKCLGLIRRRRTATLAWAVLPAFGFGSEPFHSTRRGISVRPSLSFPHSIRIQEARAMNQVKLGETAMMIIMTCLPVCDMMSPV